MLANVLLDQGDQAGAIRESRVLLEHDPSNCRARQNLVAAYLQQEKLADAERELRLVLAGKVSPAHAREKSAQIIANLEEAIADLIDRAGHPIERLAGIGVGAPGVVGADRGLIHRAANFPDWQDIPLARILSERFSLPVATTLRAKGQFPEDHPLALGCVGLYGTKTANIYLRSGVDVLLALGTSFHEFTTHVWDPAFQPSRALVQVDADPTELGKNYAVTHGVVADCRDVVRRS